MTTTLMGRSVARLDSVDSTNTRLAAMLVERNVGAMLVFAERQTDGRGRSGKSWVSPAGVNIAASLAWPLPSAVISPGLVTLSAGVALAEVVRDVCGAPATLKYPNDLYLNGRKAGGILAERKIRGQEPWAVIGLGVNVNTEEWMFPEDLRETATSIKIETGQPASREALLAGFINRLEPLLNEVTRTGPERMLASYRSLSMLLGRRVTVLEGERKLSGMALDVDGAGALLLEQDEGGVVTVISGETSLHHTIRSAG